MVAIIRGNVGRLSDLIATFIIKLHIFNIPVIAKHCGEFLLTACPIHLPAI